MHTHVVAGAGTSGCVRASVVGAMQRGIIPLVLSDCVRDRALAAHACALRACRLSRLPPASAARRR
ncbi:isochorismatase family protein (plasmid) [Caballeronia sp. M1242]|nr:isochorismatase family protein [Caballeronia sp. M1242]